MSGVAVLFLPIITAVFDQFFAHSKDVTRYDFFWTTLTDYLWILKGHVLPAESASSEMVRKWIQLLGLPLLVILIVWNRKRIVAPNYFPILVVTLTILPVFLYLRHTSGYDFFNPRHTVTLFLPVFLSSISLVWMAGRRWTLGIWLAIFVAASAASLYVVYRPLAKAGDWHRTADYVMAQETAGQPILFFTPTGALPFSFYYHGPNAVVPLPRAETFDTYDPERYVLHSESELKERIRSAAADTERVWLVTDGYCYVQTVEFNCPLLDEFIARYYVVESEKIYFGSRVRLLHRRGAEKF
jgi:hypothetical protein